MNAPGDDRDAGRRHRPAKRLAERTARREQRKEHQARRRQHQHLRAQPGAAAVADEDAPRRGEAEGRVVEHDASEHADDEEHCLPPADGNLQINGAGGDAERRQPRPRLSNGRRPTPRSASRDIAFDVAMEVSLVQTLRTWLAAQVG